MELIGFSFSLHMRIQLLIKEETFYKPTHQPVCTATLFVFFFCLLYCRGTGTVAPLSAAEDLVRHQGSAQLFSPDCSIQAHFYHEQFVGLISAYICLTSHLPKLPCANKEKKPKPILLHSRLGQSSETVLLLRVCL